MDRIRKSLAAGLLLAAAVGLAGCGGRSQDAPELLEPVAVSVDAEKVTRGEFHTTSMYEGAIRAVTEDLSFGMDGVIGEVLCSPGQWVEKGDVLFAIDQSALEAQILSLEQEISYTETNGGFEDELAAIDIEVSENELARMRASGAGANQITSRELDLEQARLSLSEAQELRNLSLTNLKAQMEELRERYGKNQIVAPCSGHVYFTGQIKVGAMVQEGMQIARITNPEELLLVTDSYVSENRLIGARYYALMEDQKLEVELIPATTEEMMAVILAGGTMTSKFRLTGPTEAMDAVSAGKYAALIIESDLAEDVLQVPMASVNTVSGESYVYVIAEDGTRHRKEIQIGKNNGIMTQVLSGLSEGEVVYVGE